MSPIALRRSERLLALRNKSKDTSTTSLSENKAAKEGISSKGESSKTTVKDKKVDDKNTNTVTGKIQDKQTLSKRLAKKSQSESDLTPKQQKRRRTGSLEDKQDLSKPKIQRTSSRTTGATSANQLLTTSKKAKSSVSEPLLTSPKGKVSSSQDKGKKITTVSKESKTLRKRTSSAGPSTSGVTTRQLRKLKGRNLTAEMSSDE